MRYKNVLLIWKWPISIKLLGYENLFLSLRTICSKLCGFCHTVCLCMVLGFKLIFMRRSLTFHWLRWQLCCTNWKCEIILCPKLLCPNRSCALLWGIKCKFRHAQIELLIGRVFTGRVCTDRVFTGRVCTDRVCIGRVCAGRVCTDQDKIGWTSTFEGGMISGVH